MELVIVIAIVIILSVVSVPIYRGYTRNAKMSEGYALLGVILSAQKAYYSQYGNFLLDNNTSAGGNRWTCNELVLGIDARGNKYFSLFSTGQLDSNAANGRLDAYVAMPKELRLDQTKYALMLYYDITKSGSAFSETFNGNLGDPAA